MFHWSSNLNIKRNCGEIMQYYIHRPWHRSNPSLYKPTLASLLSPPSPSCFLQQLCIVFQLCFSIPSSSFAFPIIHCSLFGKLIAWSILSCKPFYLVVFFLCTIVLNPSLLIFNQPCLHHPSNIIKTRPWVPWSWVLRFCLEIYQHGTRFWNKEQ